MRPTSKPAEAEALIIISAGAGGDDAVEWTATLARMYERWARHNHVGCRAVERAGEDGRRATLRMITPAARLAGENGVHRRVQRRRGRRHTSFASVAVVDAAEAPAPRLADTDLRTETFRSRGPGGQNVNKVETGVRMTHVPTGVAVRADGERTQAANRKAARQRIADRLAARAAAAAMAERARRRDVPAAFGRQRRTYVMDPYRQVRDEWTGAKNGALDAVLDGRLEAAPGASNDKGNARSAPRRPGDEPR